MQFVLFLMFCFFTMFTFLPPGGSLPPVWLRYLVLEMMMTIANAFSMLAIG